MTDDESALLRAIHANPDDDTLRLIYADWVEELANPTDQQRARAEWIRLSVRSGSKVAKKPTGKRTRVAGEPDWLRANAPRLWPNLFGFMMSSVAPRISLPTGRVLLRGSFWEPTELTGTQVLRLAMVNIEAERGVTTEITFSILRAAKIAPFAAADEPVAPLFFSTLPERCFEFGFKIMAIHRRPFMLRGLAEVWDGIEADRSDIEGELVKTLPHDNDSFSVSEAERRINRALTEWARRQAANPLVMGEAS